MIKLRISIFLLGVILFSGIVGTIQLDAQVVDKNNLGEGRYGPKVCDAGWFEAYLEYDSSPYYLCNGPDLGKTSGGFRYQPIGDDYLMSDATSTNSSYSYVSAWTKNGDGLVENTAITYEFARQYSFAKPGIDYYSMNSYSN